MKKKVFILSVSLMLSGCAGSILNQSHDYDAMCPSYNFTDSDKGKVVSVERSQDFYNTESGQIYSKRELDLMKSPQYTVINQLSGNNNQNDINSAKKIFVTKYRFEDSKEEFCGNISSDSESYSQSRNTYVNQRFYISDIKSSISSQQLYSNGNSTSTGFVLKPY